MVKHRIGNLIVVGVMVLFMTLTLCGADTADDNAAVPVVEDSGAYIVDSMNDGELVQGLEEIVQEITGRDFAKLVVLTIDEEGNVRPIIIDPQSEFGKASAELVNPPEYKQIIKQNTMSLTTYSPNPYLFCYTNASGVLECIWI